MLEEELVKSRMRNLKMASAIKELDSIIREAEGKGSNYLDFLNQLLEVEISGREEKRILRRIKQADFPVIKTFTDFDFSIKPELSKHKMLSFCEDSFLEKKENLIFVGNPGTGKTHLSIAIGYAQCLKDKKVWFTTGTGLINKLNEAKDEKALARFIKQAQNLDLIIIDEIGYFPYEKNESEILFQYISERYERGSLIITTNLGFSKWNEIFYTERLTTAILDRLIHHCHIIEIQGESYRFSHSLKNKKEVK
jgi:DNA replication protein DnaC